MNRERLKEVLEEHVQRHGTLYASKDSLALDPKVAMIKDVAQKLLGTEEWNQAFKEVQTNVLSRVSHATT